MPKSSFSKIIAGVMKWGQWGAQLNQTQMSTLIDECYDLGVTSFDHADIYGAHTTEAEWGLAFQTSSLKREQIQIITKCGIMMPSPQMPHIKQKHYDTSQGHVIHSVENSLRNLKTDYIDMLLIHRPSPLMDPNEIMKAIDLLKKSGKVLNFGVSNFTTSQMLLINSASDVNVNQIEISLFELSAFLDGTLDYCMLYDIIPMAWSPLGGGNLFSSSSSVELLAKRQRLNDVAQKYNWSLDEMVYLFLLHHPAHIRPVVGSSKLERIKVAVDCTHRIISDAQWFEIWTAATGKDVP
ncbi:MAG: aldo/keto reductase [Saprospiraceae bacterium]|nr:aldo/keto reductase [Saprospiraceae bacterium]